RGFPGPFLAHRLLRVSSKRPRRQHICVVRGDRLGGAGLIANKGSPDEALCDITSPYARLARIVVVEKGLEGRVEILEAKTRTAGSPYYQINPSGRVPYLVDDAGIGMEDSQLICAYLDGVDGKPRFRHPLRECDWAYRRLEANARSMCEGICVWVREMTRPESERSPTVLAHEVARSERMADLFEARACDPLMEAEPAMAHLTVAVSLEM